MLTFLRRRMKTILWILVVAVTVPFVFWGVGSSFLRSGNRPQSAGELFGTTVSLADFENTYAAIHASRSGERTPPDPEMIKRLTWEHLTMLEAARMAGISVSDGELARAIRAGFSPDGTFDQARYEMALRVAGVMPETYEEYVRETLMIRRLYALMGLSAWMPDNEVERRFREEHTAFTIRYALVAAAELEKSAAVTDEDVKNYYEAHRREFMLPATVKVRYLFFPWSAPKEAPAVTDEEVRRHYDEHQDEFAHGKRVRARHILFMVKGDEPGMAEQEAEKVMTKLRAGGDFAKLARKYSADETTKAKGGDLGFIEEGRMPAVFTEKAFALKAGEMAGPVKTPQGYHLIKVEEVQEPGTKPFEEVAAGIRSRIEREKAEQTKEESRNTAYAKAVDASLALVDTPDPEVVARARSLELREAGPFSETGTLEEPGSSREFTRAAFQTEPGSFSDIVEIPNKGYCIVFPKEKIEEKEKPLDAARDDIVKTLKAQKGREEAHALAVRRRAEVERRIQEKKSDFATACKELSITTEESGPFTSNKPIPGIGREPGISREAAVLQPGALSPVVDVAKGSCFFAITKREAPSAEETARGIENFRKRTLRDQEGRVLGDWSKWIHRQAKKMDRMSVPSAPEPPDEE